MSIEEQPVMELLRKAVSKVYGGRIATTNDFIELSEDIRARTGQPVSDSTLKRIWGYVGYAPRPHTSTLNILAAYAGYASLKDLSASLQVSSAFFVCDKVLSSELEPGDRVLVGWSPDREVVMSYSGDSRYIVIDSGTSKLENGDELEIVEIMKGVPLFIGRVRRDGRDLPAYVAGKSLGINKLEVLL